MVLLHGAEVGLEPLHQPVALAARGDKTRGGAAVGGEAARPAARPDQERQRREARAVEPVLSVWDGSGN